MKYTTILLLWAFFLNASAQEQDIEHYEIQGAKLGKKYARQLKQSEFEKDWHGYGNHLTSFVGAIDGAVVGTMAHKYKYQNYYHGPRNFNYRKKAEYSTDISALDIANITYADDDGDGELGEGEIAQIYFDLINTGDKPLYGIVPVVMANKTKHIDIAPPAPIDTLEAQHALRYIVEIEGKSSKANKAYLLLRIKYGQGQYADVQEIFLGTKRKK